jgi:hypothetical protein
VRNIKTRVLRRLAFAGSALDFLANGPRIDYKRTRTFNIEEVVLFLSGMARPPMVRFEQACTKLGVDADAIHPVLQIYDKVVGALADPETRQHLDQLGPEYRHDDPVWERLREHCGAFHGALADLVISMPNAPRREMIEMFLF